jgi:spore coat polysaccharide biosynthesis protein SpsF (cytidylyltransferase family)
MNIAIIQARLASTRLPRKVLLPLGADTVLNWVIRRVRAASLLDDVWVVTSVSPEDKAIVRACAEQGANVFLGSQHDVLDRYYQLARHLPKPCNVVRITADCPLIDALVIDDVVRTHVSEQNDYTSNTLTPTYPDGEDVEVFTFDALQAAWKDAALLSEREHVTPFIKNHPSVFKLGNVANDVDLSGKRWTIDEEADYIFLKKIFEDLGARSGEFGMREVLSYLARNPQHEEVNSRIIRNEGYLASLRKDKEAAEH